MLAEEEKQKQLAVLDLRREANQKRREASRLEKEKKRAADYAQKVASEAEERRQRVVASKAKRAADLAQGCKARGDAARLLCQQTEARDDNAAAGRQAAHGQRLEEEVSMWQDHVRAKAEQDTKSRRSKAYRLEWLRQRRAQRWEERRTQDELEHKWDAVEARHVQRYHDFDAARTEQFNQERHEQEAKLEAFRREVQQQKLEQLRVGMKSFADEQEREEELERVRQMREVAAYHRERDFEVRMVETLEALGKLPEGTAERIAEEYGEDLLQFRDGPAGVTPQAH